MYVRLVELPPIDNWATTVAAALGTISGLFFLVAKVWYQIKSARRDAADADAAARRRNEVLDAQAEAEIAEAEAQAEAARERRSTPELVAVTSGTDAAVKPPTVG